MVPQTHEPVTWTWRPGSRIVPPRAWRAFRKPHFVSADGILGCICVQSERAWKPCLLLSDAYRNASPMRDEAASVQPRGIWVHCIWRLLFLLFFFLMEKSSSQSWTPWSPNGTVTRLGVRRHRFCPPLCGVLRKRSGVWFSSLRRGGWPKPGGPLSSAVTYFSLHSFSLYFKLIVNIFCASTLMASLGHLQVALQTPFHRYLDKGIYKPTLIQHFIPQCKGQVYFLESLCNFTRDEISRDTDD